MFHNDLQAESAFYGKKLDVIGQLYMRPEKMKAAYPDILFFCLYVNRILVDRKVKLVTAEKIQRELSRGSQWEKIVSWAADRPFSLPARVIQYKGMVRSCISSSMMLANKVQFRFGHIGFGIFSNGRHFESCAEASIYGMMETIYQKNLQDSQCLGYLWTAAERIGILELGKELRRSDAHLLAQKIYREITGDDFPGLYKDGDDNAKEDQQP